MGALGLCTARRNGSLENAEQSPFQQKHSSTVSNLIEGNNNDPGCILSTYSSACREIAIQFIYTIFILTSHNQGQSFCDLFQQSGSNFWTSYNFNASSLVFHSVSLSVSLAQNGFPNFLLERSLPPHLMDYAPEMSLCFLTMTQSRAIKSFFSCFQGRGSINTLS